MKIRSEERIKRNLAQNKRRAENREKYNKSAREYREKNKEKINARKRTPEGRIKTYSATNSWRNRNREKFLYWQREYKRKNSIKINARNQLYKAIKREKMVRGTNCQNCKTEKGKMQAHHEDYSKPLEVIWLCRVCHRHEHGKLLDVISD